MSSAIASTPRCLATRISTRLAAVVSSVSSVPRSFSPAMESIATTAPPVRMNSIRTSVMPRPRASPATCRLEARSWLSITASSDGFTGKPRLLSRSTRCTCRDLPAAHRSSATSQHPNRRGRPGTRPSPSRRRPRASPAPHHRTGFAPPLPWRWCRLRGGGGRSPRCLPG